VATTPTCTEITTLPPPTPAPDRIPDLALHIGSGKTGTTSVQALLHRNRQTLIDHGVLFPATLGRPRHELFGLAMKPDAELVETAPYRSQNSESPQAFRRRVRRRLFHEIDAASPERVLISDEALYGSHAGSLERLRRFTNRHARRLRLVCYLRRQDDHLVSRYQQVVKVGEVRRLADRVAQIDHSHTYDYAARLDLWSRLIDPDSFVVRRFERSAFTGGSLYADFLDAVGLAIDVDQLEPAPRLNDSLDAESVEFLRLLNCHRVATEGAEVGKINNRPLVVRLAEHGSGPTLTLPEPALDAFMTRWEDSNREVARRYLGDEAGTLFREPRKSDRTTTTQRLDPDRLEHLMEVTELPDELQEPLRRLAAQERC
jgi:hypothetical protein